MNAKTTKPVHIVWQVPHYLPDISDGQFSVRCCFEMEPPIQDPVHIDPPTLVRVKNGWINQSDAAVAVAAASERVRGDYDTIVGVAFVQARLQFIVIWEHTSPMIAQHNSIN